MGGVALFRTGGGSHHGFVVVNVIQRRDDFRSGFTADGAGKDLLALGFFRRYPGNLATVPAVTLGRNHILSKQNHAADRAMLALRQTRCAAGGGNCLVGNLGVSLCGNHILRHQNLITDRAVLTFRQTRCGTGGGNRLVCNFGVPLCWNHILFNQNLTTSRTMVTFRQTGGRTGGSNCLVGHFGVTLGTHILSDILVTAKGTGIGGVALCIAGRCRHHSFVIVSRSRNHALGYNHFAADRAVFTFRPAGFGAAGSNRLIDSLRMPRSIHEVILITMSAEDADVGCVALFGAAGWDNHRAVIMGTAHLDAQNQLSAEPAVPVAEASVNTGCLGDRHNVVTVPGKEGIHIPGDVHVDITAILFQQLAYGCGGIGIQQGILSGEVEGSLAVADRQGKHRTVDVVILADPCIGQVKVGMVQLISLVIPGHVHMVEFSADLNGIPGMPLAPAGAGYDEGADAHLLKQVLESFGIALADRLTLHQSAVDAVSIASVHIFDPLSQSIVKIQLLLVIGHGRVNAGENLVNLRLNCHFGSGKLASGHGIIGTDTGHIAAGHGVRPTPDPKGTGMIPAIYIQYHAELFRRQGVNPVIHAEGINNAFHTLHDPVIGIQKCHRVVQLGQSIASEAVHYSTATAGDSIPVMPLGRHDIVGICMPAEVALMIGIALLRAGGRIGPV